jgi:hypothetical protein
MQKSMGCNQVTAIERRAAQSAKARLRGECRLEPFMTFSIAFLVQLGICAYDRLEYA